MLNRAIGTVCAGTTRDTWIPLGVNRERGKRPPANSYFTSFTPDRRSHAGEFGLLLRPAVGSAWELAGEGGCYGELREKKGSMLVSQRSQ